MGKKAEVGKSGLRSSSCQATRRGVAFIAEVLAGSGPGIEFRQNVELDVEEGKKKACRAWLPMVMVMMVVVGMVLTLPYRTTNNSKD